MNLQKTDVDGAFKNREKERLDSLFEVEGLQGQVFPRQFHLPDVGQEI